MENKKLDQQKYGKHNRAIYKLSRRRPEIIFDNASKGIDGTEYLKECYRYLNPGVVGLDGVTSEIYGNDLDQNINLLAQRVRDGYVPSIKTFKYQKELKGKLQTFEIAPIDDRIIHMAISKRLNAIFDPIFSPLNYAFRKGCGVHKMISDVYKLRDVIPDGSIAKADIQGYFSSITRLQVEECLRKKISDEKFIKQTSDLSFLDRDKGLVLGSSLSPTISNIVGHYLLDVAYEKVWANCIETCKGLKESNISCVMLRYADDLFFISNHPDWARQMQHELQFEIEQHGFNFNENKTNIQSFGYQKEIQDNSTLKMLGFTLADYQYIDHNASTKFKSSICYPPDMQDEHSTEILASFKSGFDTFTDTPAGTDLIRNIHILLRTTRKQIKQKIHYYMHSEQMILEDFLKKLAESIKANVLTKSLRPEVIDRIINNSGIKELVSYT